MPNDNTQTKLTARQSQVAELIAEGKNCSEVARALGISAGTVKVYTGHIYTRLGIGRTHLKLALWWREQNSAKRKVVA